MKYKPDWPQARERLTALWNHGHVDRPCIAVTAPNGKKWEWPVLRKVEDKWLDPDYIVQNAIATFETTYYGGEAIPSVLNMALWANNTYGATPHFPAETIWFDPIQVDWDNPPTFELNWNDPYFHKCMAIHKALVKAAGKDDFLVGGGGGMSPNDMLAFVIGTENVLLAMAERPEWVWQSILKLTENWIALVRRFSEVSRQATDYWYGLAGWMPLWIPEPFVCVQSDLSCMISAGMFDRFIVPELDMTARAFKHIWYHLDGQSAFQHLPRLLSLPYIRFIQFVPMCGTAPNGPDHIELYRKIQAAGKIVHINVPAENVEPLCKALDPGLLMLETRCESVRDADDLLASAARWTRERRSAGRV